MRDFPTKTLRGRLLALLIGALVVTQALTFVVYARDRSNAIWEADRMALLERAATVMQILKAVSPAQRDALMAEAETPHLKLWISTDAAADPVVGLVHPVALNLDVPEFRGLPLRIAFVDRERFRIGSPIGPSPPSVLTPEPPSVPTPQPPTQPSLELPDLQRLDVIASLHLPEGQWLNAQTAIRTEKGAWPWPSGFSTGLMALAIVLIVGLTTGTAMRPLNALAARAEAFGRGDSLPSLPESGPREVRRLTAAFNRMQDRLRRFISDRTQMLASIGHDLRTPITSLRIRAELIDEPEAREKMLRTLDDMQSMVEATLEFARDDAASEQTRVVDLASLLSSVADDRADMGEDVTFTETERLPYACRATALKRAVGNLVTNAVCYGERARITLRNEATGPVITVDDDGKGIPESHIEEVFQPFVRLEESRSRETGGVGLGLSIARSIVLAHGGELTLRNRPEGGLRAAIALPATPVIV